MHPSHLLALLWVLVLPAVCRRTLLASSLVTCMQNSQISPSYFQVTFDPDSRALKYNLDLSTEISGNITAFVTVYAYGFTVIQQEIDLCLLGWKQFCPLYPGLMQIESIEYISPSYVRRIPGIAYNVPDIDAVVKLVIRDKNTGKQLSCLQSSFTNGKTVSQVGIKWATAVIAGLGLLIAAILSTFGNSNAASFISANAVMLFLYFQLVVVVSMQHVERMPPIASAWAENLAWSMGLIRVTFMQKIFRWYVQATGGHPTTYFMGTTKQILVQRAQDYLLGLHDFALKARGLEYNLESNSNLIVLRGIKRIGFNSHIEPTSIVVTGFTFFVLCGLVLAGILVFLRLAMIIAMRAKWMLPTRFAHFRKQFAQIVKGAVLRYLYIGFNQLVILSLWEFTERDSAAVIVLAVIFLIVSLGVISWAFYNTHHYGQLSIRRHLNPAALLYGDSRILHKFGFCYTMFDANKYWFGIVMIGYTLVRAIFISLCQALAQTSTIVLFVLDLAYMIFLFVKRPYLNKATNIVNYCMAIVVCVNSFLFMFFSGVFGQPAQVAAVMGWVFFVLNAAFSLVLLIMILVFVAIAVLSRNPDSRFAPARDDRMSFQRQTSLKVKPSEKHLQSQTENELFALGAAAREHQDNWENEMYRLNEIQSQLGLKEEPMSEPSSPDEKLDSDEKFVFTQGEVDSSSLDGSAEGVKFGEKLKDFKRRLSLKRTKEDKQTLRLSDTLSDGSLPPPDVGHARKESELNLSSYSALRPNGFL